MSREVPEIGIKMLIPEANPVNVGAPRYLFLKRATSKDGRQWDAPGGRADLSIDVTPIDTERREGEEELDLIDIGEPIPIAIQRIMRPDIPDVIRFTTVARAQNPATLVLKLSDEHQDSAWMTRRQICELTSDRYLPLVVAENGPLHRIEKLGQIHLGSRAVEAAVRKLHLLG